MTISEAASEKTVIRVSDAKINGFSRSVEIGEWTVEEGDIWFIAGGMGSGKTPLLRAVAGLEEPADGQIKRFGLDWSDLPENETLRQRKRVGLVLSKEGGLFHRLTIRENVELPLQYHGGSNRGEIAATVDALLESLELEKHARRPSVRAGLAMARRTLLARSLALCPDVLLLDDPCYGLEDWDRRRMVHYVDRLRAGRLIEGNCPRAFVITGRSPEDWKDMPGLKWALLAQNRLLPIADWEQLVATAPELFHDPVAEESYD